MSRHEGVSCDACLKNNFRGRRYKCLICYDYDLCASCYEEGATSTSHSIEHPMQCILTRADFDIYYGGEALNGEQPQSFTCPYCKKMGFSDTGLYDHVSAEHTDTGLEVVCPVCAALPGGDPNLVTDDFAGHLTLEHRTGPRDLISFLDEPSAIRHGGVRRMPHSGRALGGPRSRRSNMHLSSSSGLSALSPSGRESVDPIAELLSQLSGVRRGAPQPSQLQQLQMQIQLERQQVSAARQQLERLPRRPHPVSSSSAANALNGAIGGGGNPGTSSLSNASLQQASITTSSGRDITITSNPLLLAAAAAAASSSMGGGGSGSSANGNGIVGFGGNGNNNIAMSSLQQHQQANLSSSSSMPNQSNQMQFLLTRFMQPTLDDSDLAQLERDRTDRSHFVQALLLSTLSMADDADDDDEENEIDSDDKVATSDLQGHVGGDDEIINIVSPSSNTTSCDSITPTAPRDDYEAKKFESASQSDSFDSHPNNQQQSHQPHSLPTSQQRGASTKQPKTGSSKSSASGTTAVATNDRLRNRTGVQHSNSQQQAPSSQQQQQQQPQSTAKPTRDLKAVTSKEVLPSDTR